MRRADVVLAAIPSLVVGGFLAERVTSAVAASRSGAIDAIASVPLFAAALCCAFALIVYEVATGHAVTA